VAGGRVCQLLLPLDDDDFSSVNSVAAERKHEMLPCGALDSPPAGFSLANAFAVLHSSAAAELIEAFSLTQASLDAVFHKVR
jgi:hypothetical protein